MPETPPLIVEYTNYKGETSTRRVHPGRVYYGTHAPWHPEPTWLLEVYDIDKAAFRIFEMSKMRGVDSAPPAA
jgi:predicted DNA-binding transcriptional regulator YafY